MPIGDIIFLALIVIAVGSVVALSVRSKRSLHGAVSEVSTDQEVEAG